MSLVGLTPHPSQDNWQLLRKVTAADTPLAAATKGWDSIKTLFLPWNPSWPLTSLAFIGFKNGGNPAGGTFNFVVYSCRQYGSAQEICSGSAVIGNLVSDRNPECWEDTTAVGSQYKWAQKPTIANNYWRVTAGASGMASDGLGNINLSSCREFGIYVEVVDIVGLDAVDVLITGYSQDGSRWE